MGLPSSIVRRIARGLPVPVLLLIGAAPLLFGFDVMPVRACGGALDELVLPDGQRLCTHGPDAAPGPAGGPGDTFASAGVPSEPVAADPVRCYDDGRSGHRVQVLYAHEAGTADRSDTLDADLRRWVGQAEWTVATSAAATGGRRHIRFVTRLGGDGCEVDLRAVSLPDGSFDTFSDTLSALVDAGYARADRKYLVFADVDHGACGLATVPNDDRKVAENRANTTVGYARVDADCWRTGDNGYYSVAAHELTHTFGGVQASAPHATDGRHCTDEWDAMCYADGPSVSVEMVCEDDNSDTVGEADRHNRLLDCGHDDYFHTSPAATSYLGRHWNSADSVYLADHPSDGPGGFANRDVAPDPEERPIAWSGVLGATRPLLADAHGWESCDLPVTVRVAGDAESDGGVGGLLGGDEPASPLRSAVEAAVTAINDGVGTTVLSLDDQVWGGTAVAEGELGIRWGGVPDRHDVSVTTRAVRIRRATLTLDTELRTAPRGTRDLTTLQGLVRALGVGLTDTTGELTSRYARAGADRTVAMAALRHLYTTPCDQDARLDDTLAGERSQRLASGTRQRIDLADDASTPIAAAVEVAEWLREQRGGAWADRAIVCRDDVHADCLAGTALVRDDGPVVFVPGGPDGTLPGAVRDVLAGALGVGADVHVLGGPAAVSDQIVAELKDALPGRDVARIAGDDRYATAAAVAREVAETGGSTTHAILTRADDPADAVAAGAAAAEQGIPVVLTATDHLPAVTQLALTDLGVETVLIAGGPVAVSDQVESIVRSRGHAVARMAGRDRFETAVAIARAPALWSRTEVRRSGSVLGLNGRHAQTWNLAIAAAPVGAHLDAPVLFTTADELPSLSRTTDHAGGTLQQLRDLGVRAESPTVRTIFVGAGTWSSAATAEAFHARSLPGFGGNVSVATE